jgi:hypothetical protein
MKDIYIVYTGSGSYQDYYEFIKFVTFNKSKAEKWVARFNKIVDDNKDRIRKYYQGDMISREPFMGDLIYYNEPNAGFKTEKFIK